MSKKMIVRCANCLHARLLGKNGNSYQCRRFPPIVVAIGIERTKFADRFPTVVATNWCGEFEPKTEQRKEANEPHEAKPSHDHREEASKLA